MSKGTKLALGVLVFLGVLVALAFGLLSNKQFTSRLGHEALSRLAGQIPADVTFGELSINPVTGLIAVNDLAVRVPGHPQEQFLGARQVILDMNMPALLGGKVRLTRLHLVNPQATVIHRGQNRYNFQEVLPKTKPEAKQEGPSFLTLERVTFEGGRVTYIDDPRHAAAEIPHLKGALDLDLHRNAAGGHVTFSDGWARYEQFKQPLESFLADFNFTGEDLRLDKLKLDAGSTGIAVQGAIDGLAVPKGAPARQASPRLHLSANAQTKLDQFASLARMPMQGAAQASFEVRGTLEEPQIAGTVSGQKLGVQHVRVPQLMARLQATRQGARIEQLRAEAWGGRVTAEGRVPFQKQGRLDLTANAERLDLAELKRQLAPQLQKPLVGVASAHVEAHGLALTPEAIAATGWLQATGRVPLDTRPLPVAVRTNFQWKDAVLRLSDVDVQALGGRLSGRGQLAPLAKVPSYSANLALANMDLSTLQSVLDRPLPATGQVSAELSLMGEGFQQPSLRGTAAVRTRATAEKGLMANKRPLPLSGVARVAFEGRSIRLNELDVRSLGGHLNAQGTIDLRGRRPELALTAQASGLDLSEINRTFGLVERPLTGRLNASAAYDGRTLTLRRATAQTLGGQVTAAGRVGLGDARPNYDLNLAAQGLNLATINHLFKVLDAPVSGTVATTMRVRGSGPVFQATGPIALQGQALVPSQAAGARARMPFSARGQLAVTPASLQLSPLRVTAGPSQLTANGTVRLDGTSNLRFEGTVTNTPQLARLFGIQELEGAPITLRGQASGHAKRLAIQAVVDIGQTSMGKQLAFKGATFTLSGTLADRLRLNGRLAATQLAIAAQNIDRLEAPLVYEAPRNRLGAGTLRLPQTVARLNGARLVGNVTLRLDQRSYVAQLRSEGLRLENIDALRTQQAQAVPLDTPLSVAIRGQGRLAAPELTARIELAPFNLEDRRFGQSIFNAVLKQQRATVDGRLFGDQFTLDGKVGLAGDRPVLATLRFHDADLRALLSVLPTKPGEQFEMPVSSTLTGAFTLDGPLSRPSRLTAAVDLSDLNVTYQDLALRNQSPLRVSYRQNRVQFEQFHLVGTNTNVSVRGGVGLGVPSTLTANGRINMAILEKFSPKSLADSAGVAYFDAQLRGTLGQPDLAGAVTIRNGELSTRGLPQPIHDLNASLRVTPNRLFLDNFAATLGFIGRIQASGGAVLGKDFMPTFVNLEATANELEVRIPDVRVLANADLAFSGTPDNTRLSGTVRVLQGNVTRDVDITGALLGGGRGAAGAPARPLDVPFLRNVALRTQVLVPDQFMIDNNVAQGELRADMLVLGTLARPALIGRAETITGKVFFQDHTYTLEEASVDFIDPSRLTPFMHVVATSQIAGYDVRVQANGTPDKFKLDLTSTPVLPQQSILVLIATGQAPGQFQAGEGLATAGNLLLNTVTRGIAQGVTSQGVVDVLRIQPGATSSGSTMGGSLTVGKRLTERLMVTYTQDLLAAPGEVPGRVILFDYLLTDQIVLKLEQRLGGGFNASARYRFPLR